MAELVPEAGWDLRKDNGERVNVASRVVAGATFNEVHWNCLWRGVIGAARIDRTRREDAHHLRG